ncbi:MAG TPA: DUF2845 domain-containing protein [Polyangia bacterium]|jgi:hypothetical protein|nr:DUF2845 domain-containing protein [Polyangia bacterium]
MRVALVISLLLGFASAAQADTVMNCGDRLVSIGETTGAVAIKCGAPTFQAHRDDTRTSADGSTTTVGIDTWTYNFGPQNFIRTLTFANGSLRRIVVGDYGD